MAKKTAATKAMGRPSIFAPKDGDLCVRTGPLTKVGTSRFESARARLAAMAGWVTSKVSDSDVIEFLVRGEEATAVYLNRQ